MYWDVGEVHVDIQKPVVRNDSVAVQLRHPVDVVDTPRHRQQPDAHLDQLQNDYKQQVTCIRLRLLDMKLVICNLACKDMYAVKHDIK